MRGTGSIAGLELNFPLGVSIQMDVLKMLWIKAGE